MVGKRNRGYGEGNGEERVGEEVDYDCNLAQETSKTTSSIPLRMICSVTPTKFWKQKSLIAS